MGAVILLTVGSIARWAPCQAYACLTVLWLMVAYHWPSVCPFIPFKHGGGEWVGRGCVKMSNYPPKWVIWAVPPPPPPKRANISGCEFYAVYSYLYVNIWKIVVTLLPEGGIVMIMLYHWSYLPNLRSPIPWMIWPLGFGNTPHPGPLDPPSQNCLHEHRIARGQTTSRIDPIAGLWGPALPNLGIGLSLDYNFRVFHAAYDFVIVVTFWVVLQLNVEKENAAKSTPGPVWGMLSLTAWLRRMWSERHGCTWSGLPNLLLKSRKNMGRNRLSWAFQRQIDAGNSTSGFYWPPFWYWMILGDPALEAGSPRITRDRWSNGSGSIMETTFHSWSSGITHDRTN